jgi:hypothetical protein
MTFLVIVIMHFHMENSSRASLPCISDKKQASATSARRHVLLIIANKDVGAQHLRACGTLSDFTRNKRLSESFAIHSQKLHKISGPYEQ